MARTSPVMAGSTTFSLSYCNFLSRNSRLPGARALSPSLIQPIECVLAFVYHEFSTDGPPS